MQALPDHAKELVDPETTLFWFRRDLRFNDNAGLFHALKENRNVLALFIFDTNILDQLENRGDARVTFIHNTLTDLANKLQKVNSALLVIRGNPVDIFRKLNPKAIYANRDYEPYGIHRDESIRAMLEKRNIPFKTFKDHVIFEMDEVVKSDRTPYSIFTPYSRRWKEKITPVDTNRFQSSRLVDNFKHTPLLAIPSLETIGFTKSSLNFPKRQIRTSMLSNYASMRNIPGIRGTSRLGVHLRFGTISIRQLVQVAQKKSESWMNELIWRDFYHMILWHFPLVAIGAFKPAYNRIDWRNDPSEFMKWCDGMTGYPIVDAGMRELNTTGFMHNRVRMIVASFLTKHLLIDWRWGEAYFAKKLQDFDLAANNGGWQWAAGCGCDAAPYFRVFNPTIQANKFDPNKAYIRMWVPEFETNAYPPPMVIHEKARARAIAAFQKALR